MGSVSSCTSNCLVLCTQPINTIDCNCLCIPHLINMYKMLFQRGRHEAIPALPLTDTTSLTVPTMNTFTSPPIPLPYNDPIFRMTRGARQLAEEDETEPLREEGNRIESDKWGPVCYTSYDLKGNNVNGNSKMKDYCKGGEYYFGSSDDEDVCPTCLDEYTEDNPKIVMQCSHDFHLGCIYEWMERSEACPVCGKRMVFSESN
ncbi:hypothetical protein LUZ60_004601 [Juncus effusus]|nr:hypothetical protein LUZ60_004601 [Juncus effusus]